MSVYFATCREANAVKIGSSVDPWGRLPELQMGCPLAITIEAIVTGGIEEEFAFHRRFEDDRIRGEWFNINMMIETIISAHPAGPQPRKLIRTAKVERDARSREIRRDPNTYQDRRQRRKYAAAMAEMRAEKDRTGSAL